MVEYRRTIRKRKDMYFHHLLFWIILLTVPYTLNIIRIETRFVPEDVGAPFYFIHGYRIKITINLSSRQNNCIQYSSGLVPRNCNNAYSIRSENLFVPNISPAKRPLTLFFYYCVNLYQTDHSEGIYRRKILIN